MRKRLLSIVLVMTILLVSAPEWVRADKLSDAQNAKNKAQQELEEENAKINSLKNQEAALQAEIDALDEEIIALIADMNILAQELEDKTAELEQVTQDLADAEQRQADQYEAMKKRIRYMYENGDQALVEAIFGSSSMADMLNRVEYVNDVYEYDRNLLAEYKNTVQEVKELKSIVETEKAEMEAMQAEYEAQEEYLNGLLSNKKSDLWSTDSLLQGAKARAAAYQAKIEEQNRIIKQEEERKKKEEEERKKKEEEERKKNAASSGSGSTGGGSAPVSGNGQAVINYACQFVGNPYVWGGTSLTNGADCSGYIMSIYAHFGVSLPHSSAAMRSCGVGVSYENATAGDIICYAGHVALYMGNGRIVHAQSTATGICYGSATYRPIVAIRRVI